MNSGILGKIKDLVLKHYLWVYAVYFIVMFLGKICCLYAFCNKDPVYTAGI